MRLVCLCALTLSACTSSVTGTAGVFESEADYRQQRAAAVASLDAAIGEPAASRLSACRAVAVGDQACGGPTSYSVYSTETADAAQVEAAADRVTTLDQRANVQFEYASTCAFLTAPPLAVQDGVCVAI